MSKNIIIATLAVLLILLGAYSYNKKIELASNKDMIESLNSTLTKYRDNEGNEVSEKQAIISDYASIKKLAKGKDTIIAKLAKEIDKQTIMITKLANRTDIIIKVPMDVEKWDTQYVDKFIYLTPNVHKGFSDRWITYNLYLNKDSLSFQYQSFNEYIIKQEYKRKWFLGKEKTIISIKNLNPNTTTIALDNIVVKPKTKKGYSFGFGIIIGASAILGLNYLIK